MRAIRLFRSILREHRKLPVELRVIGDDYVKNEFHLHKTAKDPEQLRQFFVGWEQYLQQLRKRKSGSKIGVAMDELVQGALSEDQMGRMNDLRAEIQTSSRPDNR